MNLCSKGVKVMCAKKNKNINRHGDRIFIPYEKEDKGPSWIAVAILLCVFWPIGVLLGVKKVAALWHSKKMVDYRNYAAVIGDRLEVDIHELSAKLGKTPSLVLSDLQVMIDKGYLGSDAYIDRSRGVLVLDAAEAESANETEQRKAPFINVTINSSGVKAEINRERKAAPEPAQEVREPHPEPKKEPEPKREPEPQPAFQENEFEEKLRQIRRLNDQIDDEGVSNRIDRIGELTASIFAVVRQKPDRADEVKKFMNYYLPTTFKLLNSYALMEKQSYQGENIVASRKKIENILDSLITAFEQQQDRLFRTEALDVEADIQVLETMMAKDGLVTPKGLDLRAMGGKT